MIVTCPACQVKYVTERSAFPEEGRILRCSSCGHSWRQKPLPVQAAPMPAPVAPAVKADDSKVSTSSPVDKALLRIAPLELFGEQEISAKNHTPSPMVFGWLALLAIVAMLGGAAYFMRDTVRQHLPSTRPIYNLMLANDEARQFIENPTVERLSGQNGSYDLLIKGQVRNQDVSPVPPPPVMITVQNAAGVMMMQERFDNYPLKLLLPKSTVPFEVRMKNIPADAVEVKIEALKPTPEVATPDPAPTPPPAANEPVAVPQAPVEATPTAAPVTPPPAVPEQPAPIAR